MYGPSWEYLWQFGLVHGQTGQVKGRSPYNDWLYVKMDGYTNYCWIPGYQLNIVGDVNTVIVQEIYLPWSGTGFYTPPAWVRAERKGDQVFINWPDVYMTEDDDRGYFLDLFLCKDGTLNWAPKNVKPHTQTEYIVVDEPGCSEPSGGTIYTVEKHGYVYPGLTISWP